MELNNVSSGLVEEYSYNLNEEIKPLNEINKYFTKHQGPIRMTKKITDTVYNFTKEFK